MGADLRVVLSFRVPRNYPKLSLQLKYVPRQLKKLQKKSPTLSRLQLLGKKRIPGQFGAHKHAMA